MTEEDFELEWEEVSGRRDPKQRYRIYRVHHTDEYPVCLATCETESAVGLTICTLAREHEFDGCAVGILDTMGEKGLKWLVNPYDFTGAVSKIGDE